MVFIVSQEYEELHNKFVHDIINMDVIDGFRINKHEDNYIVCATMGGTDRYICTLDNKEKCNNIISLIMRSNAQNESYMVLNVDNLLSSPIDDLNDKDSLLEIILGLLEKYGHSDIVDKYIDIIQADEEQTESGQLSNSINKLPEPDQHVEQSIKSEPIISSCNIHPDIMYY